MMDQIADNVFLIRGRNNGRFPFSHSVVVTCKDGGAVLIDTGCGIDLLNEIKARFDVQYVVNSHTHPDHSAGNWVLGESKVKAIYVPEEGFETSGNIKVLSERFAEPGPLAEFWTKFVVNTMGMKDCRPTDSFSDRRPLELGGTTLVPVHTPGHTVDHYCIYEPEKRILFSFDFDLTPFGPWYGHRESIYLSSRSRSRNSRKSTQGYWSQAMQNQSEPTLERSWTNSPPSSTNEKRR